MKVSISKTRIYTFLSIFLLEATSIMHFMRLRRINPHERSMAVKLIQNTLEYRGKMRLY